MVNLQKPVSSPIETDQTLTTALSEAIEEKGEIIEQLHDISALAAEIRLLKGKRADDAEHPSDWNTFNRGKRATYPPWTMDKLAEI